MAQIEDSQSLPLDEKFERDENNSSQTPSRHEEASAQFNLQHDSEQDYSASTLTQTNEDQNHNMRSEAMNENGKFKPGFLSMGGGKPYPPELLGENEAYLVDFDGPDDAAHPQNWPMSTKLVRANPASQLVLTNTE